MHLWSDLLNGRCVRALFAPLCGVKVVYFLSLWLDIDLLIEIVSFPALTFGDELGSQN
jgi:hypothetical protein